jgi:hypothetical protein
LKKRFGQGFVLLWEDGAQVEEEAAIGHPGNDRRVGGAQAGGKSMGG